VDCGTVIRNDDCLVPHYLLRECGRFACPLIQKGNFAKKKLRWAGNVKNLHPGGRDWEFQIIFQQALMLVISN
jgi:hypothetical protein